MNTNQIIIDTDGQMVTISRTKSQLNWDTIQNIRTRFKIQTSIYDAITTAL